MLGINQAIQIDIDMVVITIITLRAGLSDSRGRHCVPKTTQGFKWTPRSWNGAVVNAQLLAQVRYVYIS